MASLNTVLSRVTALAALATAVACSSGGAGSRVRGSGGASGAPNDAGVAGRDGSGADASGSAGAGGVGLDGGADACRDGGCAPANPCIVEDCSVTPCKKQFDSDACDDSVPSDVRDRFGIYAWGFDTTPVSGEDALAWAADRIAGLGGRSLRVYIGPTDSYGVNPPGPFDLRQTAESPAYAQLFSDPRFDVVFLTAYTSADQALAFADGLDSSEQAAERNAIAELGEYLLQTFENKTFVILQWEGDNQLQAFGDDPTAWTGFQAWIDARAAGVADANLAVPSSSSRLYSGLEFNRVEGCGASERCVISDVAPNVPVNYYAYSSYESINVTDPTKLAPTLTADLNAALGFVKAKRPKVSSSRFVLGEFGFAREVPYLGECQAAQNAMATLGAARSWGAAYTFYWQIGDNPPSSGFWTGFGLYKWDGSESRSAGAFAQLYASGAIPTPDVAGCPLLNTGGVVSATTHDATIHPNDALEAYGTGFSGTGDVVRVRQGEQTYEVVAGSPYFYDSGVQINFELPAAIASGSAAVWIRRADGVESNSQMLTISP
jgi:hypothetical protein